MDRRSFLRGLVAAPAIVAYSNIMPVKLFYTGPVLYGLTPLEYSFAQTKEIVAANILSMQALRDMMLPGLREVTQQYYKLDFRRLLEDSSGPIVE